MSEKNKTETENSAFKVIKRSGQFVDEIANISISPNGACRLQLCTWATDDDNQPVRVDSELIMTMHTLETLSSALPKALEHAKETLNQRKKSSETKSIN